MASAENSEICCLVCFHPTVSKYKMSSQEILKIFNNCSTFLHSTMKCNTTWERLQEKFLKEMHLPLCTCCFESVVHLTSLTDQLAGIQKTISDLTVELSLSVLYRRSQIKFAEDANKSCRSTSSKQTIELDVSVLFPRLFTMQNPQNTLQLNPENFNDETVNSDVILENLKDELNHVSQLSQPILHDQPIPHDSLPDTNVTTELESEELFVNLVSGENNVLDLEYRNVSKYDADPLNENEVEAFVEPDENKADVNISTIEVSDGTSLKTKRTLKIRLEKIRSVEDRISNNLRSKYAVSSDSQSKSHSNSSGELRQPGNSTRHRKADRISPISMKHKRRVSTVYSKHNMVNRTTKERPEYNTQPQCEYCSKVFSSNWNLQIHTRIHTGEKPFKCSFCKKSFTQQSHLRAHKMIHTGEKPYECSFCKKAFSQKWKTKVHERRHTGEKPYKCLYCDKSYSVSWKRTQHQQIHTHA